MPYEQAKHKKDTASNVHGLVNFGGTLADSCHRSPGKLFC